jgi:hypothetical protein
MAIDRQPLMLLKECANVFYKFLALNSTGMTGSRR